MSEQEYAAMITKYTKVTQEEGHSHPGMVYDPVFDQWNPVGLEAALYQLFAGKSSFTSTHNVPTALEEDKS
jgi:hypothetical protein